MALSSKERQERYRHKNRYGRNDQYRLNTFINISAHLSLKRVAEYRGMTVKALIEDLAQKASDDICDSLPASEHDTFYSLGLTKPKKDSPDNQG